MSTIEAEVRLRPKNQVTLPERIVARLGAEAGDRLVITVDDVHPDRVVIRRLPHSYAGVAAGIYGSPEEIAEYLRAERAAWDQ